MPIHLEDQDVVSELAGVSSALIVPCYMCPAVTVAVREDKPFLRLFRNFLKSAPFEEHIRRLQSSLEESGVRTEVFKSRLPHHWFQCMWGAGRREKLRKCSTRYEAVIVLGNLIGSNVFNILFILGLTSVIRPVEIVATGIWLDLAVMMGISLLVWLFLATWSRLTRWEGAILLVIYLGYMTYLFV